MPTRLFSDLLPRLAPSVPGCPNKMMLQYLADAARRACERTLLWRVAQPTFALLPGVPEYAFEKPADTDVHILFAAFVNDYPLDRLPLEDALYRFPEWADLYSGQAASTLWSSTPDGAYNTDSYNEAVFNENPTFVLPDAVVADASTPRAITQLTPDKYVVLPMPDNERTYTMRMIYAVKPTRTATGMDQDVLDDLEDTIIHGALQHLLVIPNVQWADRELAAYHSKQLVREVGMRRAQANLNAGRGVMVASGPKFA